MKAWKSIGFWFGLLAITTLILDKLSIEIGYLVLGLNPILVFLKNHFYELMVLESLQGNEVNSLRIHYSMWAYLVHFVSVSLLGVLIDGVMNVIFKRRKGA